MTPTTSDLRVDPSNAEVTKAWDGDEGAYWAAHADRFDRSVAAYHLPFLDAAAIGPDEQVLDIGCGTGQTTRDAARRAASGGALGGGTCPRRWSRWRRGWPRPSAWLIRARRA